MADSNDLRVIVGLNVTESAVEIEKDLPKLEKALEHSDKGKLKIVAGLNTGKTIGIINHQLKDIAKNVNTLKLTPQLDISGKTGSQGLQQIQNSAEKVTQSIEQAQTEYINFSKQVADAKIRITATDDTDGITKNLREQLSQLKGFENLKVFDWAYDATGKVKSVTAEVQLANNQIETLYFNLEKVKKAKKDADGNTGSSLVFTGGSSSESGIIKANKEAEKLSTKIEETRTKYTRLLEEFKSSNSAIETGLTQPISDFQNVLNELGTTKSIDDVKNQFEKLKTSAAEISKYLDTTNNSFNKTRNAINNYNQMDDSIKKIEASYGNLVVKNEQLGKSVDNLRSHYSELVTLQETEKGYTVEWAKAYQSVNAELKEVRVNVEAAVRAESNSQNADRNSQYQVQQRYLDRIRENYITLNRLQTSLVTAGQNETAEIQRQIKQIRSRISYATEQLKKRQLFANVEAQINDYENEFDRKQSLRNSKETDKLIANYTKMADEISRATQELTKLQNSSTIKDNGSNAVVQNLKVQIDSVITDFNNLYERLSNSTVDKKTFVELQDQLSNIANKAKEVKNSFNDVTNAISADNKAKSQLASFQKQVESLTASIKALQSQANVSAEHKASLGGLLNEVGLAKDKATLDDISIRLTRLKGEIRETINNTSASNNLNKEFDNLSKSIDTTISKLTSLRDSSIFRNHSANSDVVAMKQQLDALIGKYEALKATITSTDRTSGNLNTLKGQVKTLGTEFETASGKAKQFQTTLRNSDSATLVTSRIQKLTAQIKEYMTVNTKASKKYSAQFNGILGGLSNAEINKDAEAVKRLTSEFQILRSQIRAAGDQGKTFGQTLVDNIKKFSSWLSLTSLVMRGVRELKQMVTTVREIDTAMVALKRVTDETASSYEKFLKNTAKEAQRLHTTIDSLTTQITEWVKLGNSLDTATQLAEISMMYAKVGDIDDETAVKDLVATMKAFNIEADKSISIVDALDTMNNKYASTAKDLGEGLRVASSSMSAAGNSFEKTLAMLTGGTEITQNANAMALGMRTVALRIRNMKGALQELNEEYEDLESISKIQTQILNLSGVNIFDPNGNFRDTYDILKDISEVYNDLADKDKASLDTILFGTTRSNQGQALLKAFQSGQIQKALADIENSAGTAREEFTKYEQSIEAGSYLAVWKQAV